MTEQHGKIDRRTLLKLMGAAGASASGGVSAGASWGTPSAAQASGVVQAGIDSFEIQVGDDELEDLGRDRAISRARPRPTPRHPRGLGRWNHDSRVTHLRRFVERDRLVGRVSGHPCDLIVDRLNEVDANGRGIHRRLGQRVSDDHARSINSKMQRLPASVAASTVLHRSPFAFAHNRPSRAVDDEMDGSSRWDAAECNRERLTASGERGVVGGCEIDTCRSRIRHQAAAGSWTMPRQWEIQRTWLHSARAAVRSPAKPNGV